MARDFNPTDEEWKQRVQEESKHERNMSYLRIGGEVHVRTLGGNELWISFAEFKKILAETE